MPVKKNTSTSPVSPLDAIKHDLDRIASADHHDPASVLGTGTVNADEFLLFFSPNTSQLELTEKKIKAQRL